MSLHYSNFSTYKNPVATIVKKDSINPYNQCPGFDQQQLIFRVEVLANFFICMKIFGKFSHIYLYFCSVFLVNLSLLSYSLRGYIVYTIVSTNINEVQLSTLGNVQINSFIPS